ncbi:MAG: hypothetical protein WAK20_08220 [Candidatus Acidiferrum sp.]
MLPSYLVRPQPPQKSQTKTFTLMQFPLAQWTSYFCAPENDCFVTNVDRITATEVLVHERLDKDGNVEKRERRKFNYVVLVKQTKQREISIEEFRNGNTCVGQGISR